VNRPVRWLLISFLVALAACGGGETQTDVGQDRNQPSLEIDEPMDGTRVQAPFNVGFSSSEDLGTVESGASHVHLWIDGKEDDYVVIEGDSFEIGDISPGEHTITVSLRNSDHSEAGAGDEITVTVSEGG